MIAPLLQAGAHAALRPATPEGQAFADLAIPLSVIGGAITVLVFGAALAGAFRRRAAGNAERASGEERRAALWVAGLIATTFLILFFFLWLDWRAGRSLRPRLGEDPVLSIQLTGHQWWWEVRYRDPTPAHEVTTANEIHVPVGQRVQLSLTSSDVIHSFWARRWRGSGT